MKLQFVAAAVIALSTFVVGCSNALETGQIAAVQSSYANGIQAFEERDFEQAEHHLSLSLKTGGLTVDTMCDARLMRAKARIELEDFDGARDDLDFLMEGAPEVTEVLITLGECALKQGEIGQARRFYNEARQNNPKLVIPAELRP